jgi:uncharacterized membrane protein YphA (DoxX/SURF4 family)
VSGNVWDAVRRGLRLRPESSKPLSFLRIGLGLCLIAQLIDAWPGLYTLAGQGGIIQEALAKTEVPDYLPRYRWLSVFIPTIDDHIVFSVLLWAYLIGLLAFLLGWQTRIATIVTYFLHLTLKTSGALSAYGASEFAHILLFYCIWMPLADHWSIDARLSHRHRQRTLCAALALRVLRLHLAIIYLSSGISKAFGDQWRNGDALWLASMRFSNPIRLPWLADLPLLCTLGCWVVVILEIFYPVGMAFQRTRRMWLLGVVMMHVGIGLILGLWVFSGILIVFNIAAFGEFRPRLLPLSRAPNSFSSARGNDEG